MKDFKPILIFILKFILVWGVFLVLYNLYLSGYHSENKPDPYSQIVANLSADVLNFAGFETYAVDDKSRPWTWLYIDGQYRSYVNEGCNAISIMMIFVAFIVAFSTTWKQTLLYILGGLLVIQIMNIIRIAWITYILRYHHQYGDIAHDYAFPAIIYGTIVLLWIIWVKYFALKTKPQQNEQMD
jgi:exosortase family protein XrtF